MSNTLKYRRDDFSQGLVNADVEGLMAYKNRRRKSKRIIELETELNTVRHELEEIKQLLQFLHTKDKEH